MNIFITNKLESVLDLAPLRDVFDVIISLKPKGQPGDEREISEETAKSEIIERVAKAGWIDGRIAHATWEQEPSAPPEPPKDEAPPAPAPVEPEPPKAEVPPELPPAPEPPAPPEPPQDIPLAQAAEPTPEAIEPEPEPVAAEPEPTPAPAPAPSRGSSNRRGR